MCFRAVNQYSTAITDSDPDYVLIDSCIYTRRLLNSMMQDGPIVTGDILKPGQSTD